MTSTRSSVVSSPDGTTIAYDTLGAGEAVIVVGGSMRAAQDYRPFAATLASQFTVHTMDVAIPTSANQTVTVAFSAPVTITTPGVYWAHLLFSTNSATFMGWAASNEYLGPMYYAAQGGFVTPFSFTAPALTTLAAQVVPFVTTY